MSSVAPTEPFEAAARTAARPSPVVPAGPDARRRRELLTYVRDHLVRAMSVALEATLVSGVAEQELGRLALDITDREERQKVIEAMSILRSNRAILPSRFAGVFAELFSIRLLDKEPPRTQLTEIDLSALSLVDDSLLLDQLAVDRIATRSRNRLGSESVLGMRARLAALLGREWFGESDHPAAPNTLFEALRAALSEHAGRIVNRVLLEVLEPHLTPALEKAYNDANEFLKREGVLPVVRPKVASVPASRAATATAVPGASAAAAGAGTAAGGHRLTVEQESVLLAELSRFVQQLSQRQPQAQQEVARFLCDPARFGQEAPAMSAPVPQLLDALHRLQVAAPADPSREAARQQGLGAATRAFGTSLDQITAETVALVFAFIEDNLRLPETLKKELKRLKIAGIKAALIDRGFFARRDHPMRQLIDRVCEIGEDPEFDSTEQAPLLVAIARLIDRVNAGFERDLTIFAQAADELERAVADESLRREKKLAECAAHAERTEALALACEAARNELRARVPAECPAFVRAFFDDTWSAVIARARVSGDDPERAVRSMAIAERLLWSIAPRKPEEIPELAAALAGLVGDLRRGLESDEIEPEARDGFLRELMAVHTSRIAEAKDIELQRERRRAARRAAAASGATTLFGVTAFAPTVIGSPDASAGTPAAGTAAPVAATTMPADPAPAMPSLEELLQVRFQRNDQVEVIDPNGPPRRYRLAWVSPGRTLFILARRPGEQWPLPRKELNRMLEEGKARVVELRPAVEQALDAMARPTR